MFVCVGYRRCAYIVSLSRRESNYAPEPIQTSLKRSYLKGVNYLPNLTATIYHHEEEVIPAAACMRGGHSCGSQLQLAAACSGCSLATAWGPVLGKNLPHITEGTFNDGDTVLILLTTMNRWNSSAVQARSEVLMLLQLAAEVGESVLLPYA